MAVKLPPSLVRTNYLDTYAHGTAGDPDNPNYSPQTVLPRAGTTVHGETKVDFEQYLRPLEQLHGMGAHGAGLAVGLQVGATIGQPNLQIQTGLAIDPAGRHIYLAVGGQAEVGATADNPNVAPMLVAVPAPPQGVVLPTAGLNGDLFVTIQWWETFDQATLINSNGQVFQFNDTPWLRLVAAGDYDPDREVVLAKVNLNAGGSVNALSYGDPAGRQRAGLTVPAQRVQFKRAVNSAGPLVDSSAWAEARAREGGGLQLTVQNPGDHIEVLRDTGQATGNFSTMAIAANQVNVGTMNNPGIVLDGANANIIAGTAGNEGDVLVKDAGNRLTVALNGATGHVIVGAQGVPGQVRMLDQRGADTLRLDGATGSAVVKRLDPIANNIIDVGSRFFRIHGWDLILDGRSGNQNRALVDLGDKLIINYATDYKQGVQINGVITDSGGTPLMGNPARKAQSIDLLSTDGVPTTFDIDLGSPRAFSAFAAIAMVNSTTDFDYDNAVYADVYQIDGNSTGNWLSGDGSNFGGEGDSRNMRWPTWVSSFGRVITFRTYALGPDVQCAGIGVVFYE
jgi:hypothetical protein